MKNGALINHAATIGLVVIVLYVICLIWQVLLFISEPSLMPLHRDLLKITFPGFKNYDVASILWGAVLSFVYGFIASFVFHSLHKDCCDIKR